MDIFDRIYNAYLKASELKFNDTWNAQSSRLSSEALTEMPNSVINLWKKFPEYANHISTSTIST